MNVRALRIGLFYWLLNSPAIEEGKPRVHPPKLSYRISRLIGGLFVSTPIGKNTPGNGEENARNSDISKNGVCRARESTAAQPLASGAVDGELAGERRPEIGLQSRSVGGGGDVTSE